METRELTRKQLDAQLQKVPRIRPPHGGWVHTVRQALGMTMAQLAERLGVSQPTVAAMESRDRKGTISVAKLREAADALGCDLVIAFVPRVPFNEMIRLQATTKAREELARLKHTMKLEGQEDGTENSGDLARAIVRWTTTRESRLWD